MRRLGEPDDLGFILNRLGEPAELGETHDQPHPVEDGYRRGLSETVVDPVHGQGRQVVGAKFDHPLVLAPPVVCLDE